MAGLGRISAKDFSNGNYVDDYLAQQDGFIDNRTTLSSDPRIGNRDIDRLNQMANDQALADVSVDVALPFTPAIASGLRSVRGLGMDGVNYMKGLRGSASGAIADEGRRQAIKAGGAGIAAGTMATEPVFQLATKGLGLGDNIVAGSQAPISIANTIAKEKAMNSGLNHILLGSNSSLPGLPSVLSNQKKMKEIVDSAMGKMDKKGLPVAPARRSFKSDGEVYGRSRMGEDGTHITGTDDFSRASRKDGRYELTNDMKEALGDDLDEFYRLGGKIDGAMEKMVNVRDKSNLKRQRALTSKEPVLNPKEINSELKRQGDNLSESRMRVKQAEEVKKKEMNDPVIRGEYSIEDIEKFNNDHIRGQIENVNKYQERVDALNSQMKKLQETGQYFKK